MLRIRLQRKGRKKRPIWHIVVAERHEARDGARAKKKLKQLWLSGKNTEILKKKTLPAVKQITKKYLQLKKENTRSNFRRKRNKLLLK